MQFPLESGAVDQSNRRLLSAAALGILTAGVTNFSAPQVQGRVVCHTTAW
jgi:hypothetical protein